MSASIKKLSRWQIAVGFMQFSIIVLALIGTLRADWLQAITWLCWYVVAEIEFNGDES